MDTKKQFKRVGTHSGRFHADEVMATAILKELFDTELTRTRDPEILKELDLVYDVGDGEFDHHQVDKEYRDSGTPYAACGLIWRRFGREALAERGQLLQEEEIEEAFKYTDAVLIEGIDAVDNGIKTGGGTKSLMCVSSIIGGFNPTWDADISEDDAFNEAVVLASAVLNNTINQQVSAIRARAKVIEAYNNRRRPELLVLEEAYPWASSLYGIDQDNEVLFVIYPRDGDYLIQAVRESGGNYTNRKSLPKSWAGKRDEELNVIIGIDDAVFCHSARFIAGAKSLESIMKMADIAIAEPYDAEPAEAREMPEGFLLALKRFLKVRRFVIKR